jgi:hypothetical protein
MRRLFASLSGVLLLGGLTAGCEHADPLGANDTAPTLSSIQATIFNTSCAVSGCHRGSAAPLGLDLSAGNAHGNLVNVSSQEVPDLLRVEPGNPDDSYLVRKIEGGPNIIGERMPRGRPPLSDAQIQRIRAWIEDGAPAN